jgi:hypothetical protein
MGMRYLGGGVGHFTPAPMEKEDDALELEDELDVSEESVTHEHFLDNPIDKGWDEGRDSEDEDGDEDGDDEDDDSILGEDDEALEESVDI